MNLARKITTLQPPEPAGDADPEKITPIQKQLLTAYSACGNVIRAAAIVGVNRSMHYQALRRSVNYRAAFEEATQDFADLLREAATHRAVRGVKRKKFWRGRPCMVPVLGADGQPVKDEDGEPLWEQYVEVEYSDSLLIQQLRAHCPEYAERQRLEHSGPGGGPIPTEHHQDVQFTQSIRDLSAENLRHLVPDPTPQKKPVVRKKNSV